jgi:hypothetical protein
VSVIAVLGKSNECLSVRALLGKFDRYVKIRKELEEGKLDRSGAHSSALYRRLSTVECVTNALLTRM